MRGREGTTILRLAVLAFGPEGPGGGWGALLARSFRLLQPGRRAEWAWQLGWRFGRLVGSLRHRAWALSLLPAVIGIEPLIPLLP